jgi:hypothetical protein
MTTNSLRYHSVMQRREVGTGDEDDGIIAIPGSLVRTDFQRWSGDYHLSAASKNQPMGRRDTDTVALRLNCSLVYRSHSCVAGLHVLSTFGNLADIRPAVIGFQGDDQYHDC